MNETKAVQLLYITFQYYRDGKIGWNSNKWPEFLTWLIMTKFVLHKYKLKNECISNLLCTNPNFTCESECLYMRKWLFFKCESNYYTIINAKVILFINAKVTYLVYKCESHFDYECESKTVYKNVKGYLLLFHA